MGEMIQKKFREMLDSVSSASDEFVNKYFSNDSVDLNIDVSSDTLELTDDDVETIKGESDDWFDYKENSASKELPAIEKEENKEPVQENVVETSLSSDILNENSASNDVVEESVVEVSNEVKPDEEMSNKDIESELGINVDTSVIENEIKESFVDDLNLNYDYDSLKSNLDLENKDEFEKKKQETIETVEDTQYKKLSGDELISLLDEIDNGEDFFKKIEVIND